VREPCAQHPGRRALDAEELASPLRRAYKACGWDITPDNWTREQRLGALATPQVISAVG